jgi:uncharacterized protein YcfJ
MPESHQRHKQKHHHHQAAGATGKKKKITAATFMAVMGGIFGLSFGYFTGDRSLVWSVVGTVAGILAGYYFGHKIDISAAKKS